MFPYNPNIPAILNLAAPAVQHHNNPANNLALPAGGPAFHAAAQLGAQFMEDGNEPESPPHLGIQMPANILNAPRRPRRPGEHQGAAMAAPPNNDFLANLGLAHVAAPNPDIAGAFLNALQAVAPPAQQVPNSPDSGTSAQTAMYHHQTP